MAQFPLMRRVAFLLMVGLLSACNSIEREFTAPPVIDMPTQTDTEENPTPEIDDEEEELTVIPTVEATPEELPESVMIAVPFMIQAPHANWAMPYQEACEEASLIMVHHYLNRTTIDSAEQADKEILDMVAFEESKGYDVDVTTQDLADIAQEYYGHEALLEHDVTIERMKQILAEGYPIILPVAGRRLENPYFSGEGPFYHMLVVLGYDEDGFFTNDPGTRRGEHYYYDAELLVNAVHNWTGVKEEIEQGEPVMMILK
jgi:uncharacterized protein YvpB